MSDIGLRFKLYLDSDNYADKKKISAEGNRQIRGFTHRFTKEAIMNMELDDYVQGKSSRDSFTYLLERQLDWAGTILGATVNKFGVWYSVKAQDYKFTKRFGSSVEEAFHNVKKAIVDLINAGEKSDLADLNKSPFSEMIKSKIFYLYYPKNALPIYSKEHIDFLMTLLQIDNPPKNNNTFVKRQLIIDYKDSHPELVDKNHKTIDNLTFMQFIYSPDGYMHDFDEFKDIYNDYEAEMVDIDGIIQKEIPTPSNTTRERKYDLRSIRNKNVVGSVGERVVLSHEKKNHPHLKDKIKRVSEKNDAAGYDILSFDELGNEKYIEVKTKTDGSSNNIEFHLSRNQLYKLVTKPNYVIYYVFGLKLKVKKIIEITKDMIDKDKLVPESYLVKAEAILRQP